MLFSTTQEIKKNSWMENNPNLSELDVKKYQKRANGIVLWKIGAIYDLSEFTVLNTTEGSQAYDFLNQAEVELATWFLLDKEYWSNDLQDGVGKIKIDDALSLLDLLYDKTPVRLFDNTWSEYWKAPTANNLDGWIATYNLNTTAQNSISDDR